MIDWSLPIRTKGHGYIGKLLYDRDATGRRRVSLPQPPHYRGFWTPKNWEEDARTTYLYAESGVCRCDGQPGPFDLENFD